MCVGRRLVLRVGVLVRWLCAGFGCSVGLAFPLGGYCFSFSAVQPTRQCMVGATASLWLVGRVEESLTKAFKEQGKTLKALLQGVYQQNSHLQALVPDDYFEFGE